MMQKLEPLPDLRCAKCGRLLARGKGGILQIKCRSCKTINHYHGHEPTSPNARERQGN